MRAIAAVILPLLTSVASAFPSEGKLEQFPDIKRGPRLDETKLRFFPAPEPNGIGVLVVPGGGYSHVSLDREGQNTTDYLNARGYDAWMLNYTVTNYGPDPVYPAPINEALDAVSDIRDSDRVSKLGIWGYSAGGHLAAITVTNSEADLDFGVLAYPVITMESNYAHAGSRTNLIGDDPSDELVDLMSAEQHVSNSTPPIFLFHTANYGTVKVENTLVFVDALVANDRPFQVLILPDGAHGLALAWDDPVRNWTPELERWLKYSI